MDQWHLEIKNSGFWAKIAAVGERELEIIFQEDDCVKMQFRQRVSNLGVAGTEELCKSRTWLGGGGSPSGL